MMLTRCGRQVFTDHSVEYRPRESFLDAVTAAGVYLHRFRPIDGWSLMADEFVADGRPQLRPAGLRLHCTSKGFSIVSIVRPNLGSQSSKERLHYLSNLNSGDLALLYRALTERVPAKTVAATVHSTISLRKLEGAGLAWVNDHRLCLTELARTALEG